MSRRRTFTLAVLAVLLAVWWASEVGRAQETGPPGAAPDPGDREAPEAFEDDTGDVLQTEEPMWDEAGFREERPGRGAGPRRIAFNFRGASLDEVIEAVAEASGLDFIKAAEVGGTVTIVTRQPLSVDDALNVLAEVLRVRGATLLRSGDRVTIVPLEEARTLTTKVLQGRPLEEIPDTAEIIHWIEPLRYVDAGRLAQDLAKLMPAYGNLAANADSNTLIITDTAAGVKRLLTIIKAIDNPQVTTSTVRLFPLRNADARSLVDPLMRLFSPPESERSARLRMERFRMMMAARGGGQAQVFEPSERQQVRIVADERTNTLIVSASPETLQVIEQLITQLDAEEVGALLDLRVFVLKNADAQEVARVVRSLFSTTEQASRRLRQLQEEVNRLRFRRGEATAPGPGITAALKEVVRVATDSRTNAVIVMATEDNLQIIAQLIEELDNEAAATPQTVAIIPLENADPADLAQVLADILTTDEQRVRVRRATRSGARLRPRPQPFSRQPQRSRTPQRRTQAGSSRTRPSPGAGGSSRQRGGGRSEGPSVFEGMSADAAASGPEEFPHIAAIPGVEPGVTLSPGGPAVLGQERRLDVLRGGPERGPRAEPARLSRPEFEQGESITITYDERTGALIVSAPEGTLELIREIVKRLDADPAEKYRSMVYHLNNADATELADVLNNMFVAAAAAGVPGIAAELRGEVLVVPDVRTNSIIITTAPRNFDLLLPIIEDLDKAPPQVLIQVLLAEVTLDKSLDLGLDFATWDQLGFGEGQPPREFGAGGTTLFYSIINRNLAGFLNFLQSKGKLDILSRPQILASDNQPAQINVGQQVPFIRRVQFTEAGNTISTIEYEDVGIILTVTPHINPTGAVNLEIQAENSSISESTVPISEQISAAVFNRELASTTVAIDDGETIVIGGLIENTTEERLSKVPLLGDIPLLGDLFFKNRSEQEVKKELLIILTPRVVRTKEELARLSQKERGRTRSLQRPDIIELAPPSVPAPEGASSAPTPPAEEPAPTSAPAPGETSPE